MKSIQLRRRKNEEDKCLLIKKKEPRRNVPCVRKIVMTFDGYC